MGDHFILLADRLLTESSLEDVIESKNRSNSANEKVVTNDSGHRMDLSFESLPKKLAECRICHDEDEDSNMETPFRCSGSLKYAHHRCVQRWCNEKGNTICEICLQFMTLLVLRHTLPIIINGTGGYTVTVFMMIMLRFIGVLLPIYIMVRAFSAIQCRQQTQVHEYIPSDEENNLPRSPTRLHLICIH